MFQNFDKHCTGTLPYAVNDTESVYCVAVYTKHVCLLQVQAIHEVLITSTVHVQYAHLLGQIYFYSHISKLGALCSSIISYADWAVMYIHVARLACVLHIIVYLKTANVHAVLVDWQHQTLCESYFYGSRVFNSLCNMLSKLSFKVTWRSTKHKSYAP